MDYDKSYPYLLEKKPNTQIYTFGHSGANLIHYTKMAEYAVENFSPNILVVNVVENDFRESIFGNNRKDNWSLDPTNTSTKIPPSEITNLWVKRLLRKSALIRYLTINIDLINTSPILNKLFYTETKRFNSQNVVWNDEVLNELTQTFIKDLKKISMEKNVKLLLVLDGNRKAIYENIEVSQTEHYRYNEFLKSSASELNIPTIDLTEVFKKDWQLNKTRFDWGFDEHWNEYSHRLIAQTLNKHFEDGKITP